MRVICKNFSLFKIKEMAFRDFLLFFFFLHSSRNTGQGNDTMSRKWETKRKCKFSTWRSRKIRRTVAEINE